MIVAKDLAELLYYIYILLHLCNVVTLLSRSQKKTSERAAKIANRVIYTRDAELSAGVSFVAAKH